MISGTKGAYFCDTTREEAYGQNCGISNPPGVFGLLAFLRFCYDTSEHYGQGINCMHSVGVFWENFVWSREA
jgi:hypothetical protein